MSRELNTKLLETSDIVIKFDKGNITLIKSRSVYSGYIYVNIKDETAIEDLDLVNYLEKTKNTFYKRITESFKRLKDRI